MVENKAQEQYLTDLVNLSVKLNQARNPVRLYDILWQYLSSKVGVSTFFIGLYNPVNNRLTFPRAYDNGVLTDEMEDRILDDNREKWGISGYIIKSRHELSWPTLEDGVKICRRYGIHAYQVGMASESCLFLPLKRGLKILGLISFQSGEKLAFNDDFKNSMRSLANLIFVALEKHELIDAEERRHRQEKMLLDAARRISAHLQIEVIYRIILEELEKLIPFDAATIQLYQNEAFVIKACKNFSNPKAILNEKFSIHENNPNSLVFQSRESLVLENAPEIYPQYLQPPHDKTTIRSWMGIPLRVGGRWVGLLDISKREKGFFTKEHQRLAEALAAYAALAIINAQSIQSKDEANKYLESLLESSSKINASDDVKDILKKIVDHARIATSARHAFILQMNQGDVPILLAESGFTPKNLTSSTTIRPDGISWKVFHSGTPYFNEEIEENNLEINPKMIQQNIRATACLPMKVNGKVIGVLWIHFSEPRQLSESEKHALDLFINQSAWAYERIRLIGDMQLTQMEAQSIASKSVEGYHDATLKAIVAAVQKVMSCDSISLYKYNQEQDAFEFPPILLGSVDSTKVLALRRVSDRSIVRKVLQMDGVYITENAQGSDSKLFNQFERLEGIAPYVVREKIISVMAFPLKMGSHKVGVMFINYRKKHIFSERDRVNAALFANQAAITIYNSQLYERTSQQAVTLQAIYDAGLGMTTDYNLKEILDRIAFQAWSLTGRYGLPASLCNVSLVNEQDKLQIMAVYRPKKQPASRELYKEIDLHEERIGVTGRAVETGLSQLVKNVRFDPDYRVFNKETISELAVPIFIDGKALGVINLEHNLEGVFDDEDVRAVEALALQAGIAVQNAKLLQGKSRGIERSEDSVSGTLISILSGSKPDLVLQTIVDSIKEYLKAWRAVALVIDEQYKEHRVLAQSGFIPPLQAAIPIRPDGISMRVMRSGTAIYKNNLQKGDPDVHPETIEQGAKAVACLPLIPQEKCIGVLWIHYKDLHEFTEEDKKALDLYASQSALAYEQARKKETYRQTKQEFSARNTLTWISVLGNTWRHSTEKYAYAIRDTIDLINRFQEIGKLDQPMLEKQLDHIRNLAENIASAPLIAPTSSEEGATQIDLRLFLRERLKTLQNHPHYAALNMSLCDQIEKPVFIRANPNWLRRALDILIDNAFEATLQKKERKLVVTLLNKFQELREVVEVQVEDNGKGIPDSLKQYILIAPVPKQKGEKGSGLGLIMARTIFQTYGGDLRLIDSSAKGTIFAFTIPMMREESDE